MVTKQIRYLDTEYEGGSEVILKIKRWLTYASTQTHRKNGKHYRHHMGQRRAYDTTTAAEYTSSCSYRDGRTGEQPKG